MRARGLEDFEKKILQPSPKQRKKVWEKTEKKFLPLRNLPPPPLPPPPKKVKWFASYCRKSLCLAIPMLTGRKAVRKGRFGLSNKWPTAM